MVITTVDYFVVSFLANIINMNSLIIRDSRVLLQQSIQRQQHLTLKLCIGTKIYKIQNLLWNSFCKRWETTQQIKVNWSSEASIQLQLYYQNNGQLKVLGEGIIDMAIFSDHFNQEIKIPLTYEGIMTGWLYCTLALEGYVSKQNDKKFLCIYKISFFFLEEEDQSFKVEIFQNTLPIFQKQFTVIQKGKTIFPNLKKPILYSDVIRLTLFHSKKEFKPISFLVDNIKRGKTTYFQSWIRNKHNNKTGDMKLQYFLQNLFLQNDRKVVSRKGLFNATYSAEENIMKISDIQNLQEITTKVDSKEQLIRNKNDEENDQQSELLIRTKKFEEPQKQKNFNKQFQIRRSKRMQVGHFSEQTKKNQNAVPCLKQTKTSIALTRSRMIQKADKKQFYFENPLQL